MFLYKGKDQGKKKRSYKAPSPAILTTTIWELETKELSKTKQSRADASPGKLFALIA